MRTRDNDVVAVAVVKSVRGRADAIIEEFNVKLRGVSGEVRWCEDVGRRSGGGRNWGQRSSYVTTYGAFQVSV